MSVSTFIPSRLLAAAGASLACCVVMAGCIQPTQRVEVAAADVAEQARASIGEEVGVDAEVSCPETLPGEVGATTTCTMTAGGYEAPITATVTEVSADGTVHLAMELGELTPLAPDPASEQPADPQDQDSPPGSPPADENDPGEGAGEQGEGSPDAPEFPSTEDLLQGEQSEN